MMPFIKCSIIVILKNFVSEKRWVGSGGSQLSEAPVELLKIRHVQISTTGDSEPLHLGLEYLVIFFFQVPLESLIQCWNTKEEHEHIQVH